MIDKRSDESEYITLKMIDSEVFFKKLNDARYLRNKYFREWLDVVGNPKAEGQVKFLDDMASALNHTYRVLCEIAGERYIPVLEDIRQDVKNET